jgi:hypothetical protein
MRYIFYLICTEYWSYTVLGSEKRRDSILHNIWFCAYDVIKVEFWFKRNWFIDTCMLVYINKVLRETFLSPYQREQFPFLENWECFRSRTTLYYTIGMLVFMEDNKVKFKSSMEPFLQVGSFCLPLQFNRKCNVEF